MTRIVSFITLTFLTFIFLNEFSAFASDPLEDFEGEDHCGRFLKQQPNLTLITEESRGLHLELSEHLSRTFQFPLSRKNPLIRSSRLINQSLQRSPFIPSRARNYIVVLSNESALQYAQVFEDGLLIAFPERVLEIEKNLSIDVHGERIQISQETFEYAFDLYFHALATGEHPLPDVNALQHRDSSLQEHVFDSYVLQAYDLLEDPTRYVNRRVSPANEVDPIFTHALTDLARTYYLRFTDLRDNFSTDGWITDIRDTIERLTGDPKKDSILIAVTTTPYAAYYVKMTSSLDLLVLSAPILEDIQTADPVTRYTVIAASIKPLLERGPFSLEEQEEEFREAWKEPVRYWLEKEMAQSGIAFDLDQPFAGYQPQIVMTSQDVDPELADLCRRFRKKPRTDFRPSEKALLKDISFTVAARTPPPGIENPKIQIVVLQPSRNPVFFFTRKPDGTFVIAFPHEFLTGLTMIDGTYDMSTLDGVVNHLLIVRGPLSVAEEKTTPFSTGPIFMAATLRRIAIGLNIPEEELRDPKYENLIIDVVNEVLSRYRGLARDIRRTIPRETED